MKVFISIDMEGISGVVSSEQCTPGNAEYERARILMTQEANAAILGARAAGATEVVVDDSHGSMRNLLIEQLDTWADLIYGSPRPFGMMEGLDDSFDVVFLVGYHARAGTPNAILDHTYSGQAVSHVEINGRPVGEIGLNAALAGAHGVPVGLVTGDHAAIAEAAALLGPTLQTVTVKRAVGNQAAICLHPEEVQSMIRQAAEHAIGAEVPPFRLETPVVLRMQFKSSLMADYASLIPGARRLDGYTVEYAHEDYLTVYRTFRAMVRLAS
jgi:D-amino peptidase